MPSTLTHYAFNKQLIKDEQYKNIYLLAGQGADVLFFYGYSLFKRENAKDVRNFGYYLHSIDPSQVYISMLRYTFSKKDEEKNILLNFTRGFMYHYALDRNIHPYVFYNTGFPYTNSIYHIAHSNFESIIDTLTMQKYGYTISTRKAIKAKNNEIKICSKMISYVAKEVFDVDYIKEDTYYKAYKDFRLVRLLIDSRYGFKKAIFNKLMKNSNINIICQPRRVKDDYIYDYLNTKNKEWIIPYSGEKVNYSVSDLFNCAIMDTRIIDNIIYNYKDNIVTQRKITKFTNNINHDGKPIDKNMTYFKLIWK